MAIEKLTPQQAKERFDELVFEMSDALEALQEFVAGLGRPDLLPLDFTFESLDRVEQMFKEALEGKIKLPDGVTTRKLATAVARYLGETVTRRLGGEWGWRRSGDVNYGLPGVQEIPGLPRRFLFLPLVVLRQLEQLPRARAPRPAHERHREPHPQPLIQR